MSVAKPSIGMWTKRVLFLGAVGLFLLGMLGQINLAHPFVIEHKCTDLDMKIAETLGDPDCGLTFDGHAFVLFLLFIVIGCAAWCYLERRKSSTSPLHQ